MTQILITVALSVLDIALIVILWNDINYISKL